MAKDDHWFKFFYKLFLISTQGWKDDEVGAYLKLLINQFDRGGLPDDEMELSKLITTYKKNWAFLKRKFPKGEDGLLRNDFMKMIREERDKKSEENKKNGSKGGKASTKHKVSENEANAKKNESHIYSSSPSYSSSQEDGDSLKGEETDEVELSREGFFTDAVDKKTMLTDIQIGATVQYISIKCRQEITHQEVREHWEAFKIQFFGQHLWYDNFEKLLAHFRDSLKIETKKNVDSKINRTFGKNNTHRAVITGTAAGAGKI